MADAKYLSIQSALGNIAKIAQTKFGQAINTINPYGDTNPNQAGNQNFWTTQAAPKVQSFVNPIVKNYVNPTIKNTGQGVRSFEKQAYNTPILQLPKPGIGFQPIPNSPRVKDILNIVSPDIKSSGLGQLAQGNFSQVIPALNKTSRQILDDQMLFAKKNLSPEENLRAQNAMINVFSGIQGIKKVLPDALHTLSRGGAMPAKVMNFAETSQITQGLQNALRGASNALDESIIIKQFTDNAIKTSKGNSLKATRAALNKEIDAVVGNNGSFAKNFAMRKKLLDSPILGPRLYALEDGIIKIDETLKQPVQKALTTLYHGSNTPGGNAIRIGDGNLGKGVYLTNSVGDARSYAAGWAGGSDIGEFNAITPQHIKSVQLLTNKIFKSPMDLNAEQVAAIKLKGFDAVQTPHETIVFDPKNIKVIGNPTTEEFAKTGLAPIQKSSRLNPVEEKLNNLPPLRTRQRGYTNLIEVDNPLFTKEGRDRIAQISTQDFRRYQSKTFENLDTLEARAPSMLTQDVSSFNDISNLNAGIRDVYRNFKEVFGNKFPEAKRKILDPFDKAKGEFIDMQSKYLKELDTKIVKDYGIKKGSKESAAVQQLGEGARDYESVVKEFGATKAKQIKDAMLWFRGSYDDLLTQINNARKTIYGNNPDKLIPKRQDYFRHFREIAQGYKGLLNIFDTPANISSELSGISEFTKPKSKWLSMAQRRLTGETEVDAVGGFLDYIKAASYGTHIDPQIQKFRNLAGELVGQTAEGANTGRLNNFIEFLHDYANDLSGKTNPLDRAFQKWIPGGRKTFKVINWANNRVKANVILGNASSSIAQIFNVPQGIADAGIINSTKGIGKSLASIFVKNKDMAESTFIKERYFSEYDKFNTGILHQPKQFAKWMITVLDEVGTKFIWNAEYQKALSQKIANPINFADNATRRMVAGRGVGEVPLVQKSKLFQVVAPFQLEVTGLWHVMKDFVDERAFGKLATLFVANYVFNKGAEAVRGSAVTFDPIQAMIDAIGELQGGDNAQIKALKAVGRIGGEVLSNLPLGQTVAATYPELGFKFNDTQYPTRKELFGRADPTRFGGGALLTRGIQDPLYKLLPPFGGQQIRRSIEGIRDANRGYSESASGRVQFPINNTPLNYLKAGLFGKNSLPSARDYYLNERTPLGEKQSEEFKQSPDRFLTYKEITQSREDKARDELSKETLRATEDLFSQENNKFYIKQRDGDVKTINLNEEIPRPQMTGSPLIDARGLELYRDSLGKRINEIYDLAAIDALPEQAATNEIKRILVEQNQVRQSLSQRYVKPKTLADVIKSQELADINSQAAEAYKRLQDGSMTISEATTQLSTLKLQARALSKPRISRGRKIAVKKYKVYKPKKLKFKKIKLSKLKIKKPKGIKKVALLKSKPIPNLATV